MLVIGTGARQESPSELIAQHNTAHAMSLVCALRKAPAEDGATKFEWIRTPPAELQDAVLGGKRKGAALRAGAVSP